MRTIIIFLVISIVTIQSFCQVPLNMPLTGLVGWYPFNGNSTDESGNGNHSTYIGSGVTLTTDRYDSLNSAYNFDGLTGSYILIPADNFPIADRTVSVWFNVPSVSNMPALLGYGGNGNCGTSFLMSLNISNLGSFNCQGHCALNQIDYYYDSLPINKWIHYVITIDSNLIKLYVNGVLKQSATTFNSNTYTIGKDLVFGVVTYVDGQAPYTDFNINYLQGKLDDIGIWNRALTQCEINQLYTGTSATTSSENITACGSYTWLLNGQIYNQTGIYLDTIPNSIGCDSIITLNLTILPIPDNGVTQVGTTLTANDSGATYQWLDCNNNLTPLAGEINQSFTATINGSYAVQVSKAGCVDTSMCLIINNVSIIENNYEHEIILYPNPTNGKLIIDLGVPYAETNISISSANEGLIRILNFKNSRTMEINLYEPEGIYFITITSNTQKAVFKAIKN